MPNGIHEEDPKSEGTPRTPYGIMRGVPNWRGPQIPIGIHEVDPKIGGMTPKSPMGSQGGPQIGGDDPRTPYRIMRGTPNWRGPQIPVGIHEMDPKLEGTPNPH